MKDKQAVIVPLITLIITAALLLAVSALPASADTVLNITPDDWISSGTIRIGDDGLVTAWDITTTPWTSPWPTPITDRPQTWSSTNVAWLWSNTTSRYYASSYYYDPSIDPQWARNIRLDINLDTLVGSLQESKFSWPSGTSEYYRIDNAELPFPDNAWHQLSLTPGLPAAVPEPGTYLLILSGLAGLGAVRWKMLKNI